LYAVLIGLVVWYVRRHWRELLAVLGDLLQAWREFWAGLLARPRDKPQAPAQQAPLEPARRCFADFVDPFLAGTADRYTPEQLVQYTFSALEAWAFEHGCPRQPDQTPHEFAQSVSQRAPGVSDDVRRLADLYCRAAYAPGTLPPASREHLRQLWQNLPQEPQPLQPDYTP